MATIENLSGWLTTVVARVCLDILRSRKSHGELPFDARMPEPIVSREDRVDPEREMLLAVSWLPGAKPLSVIGFTVRGGKIVEMDVVADPERLRRLGLEDLNN
jgi:hypothetical protein